MTNAIRQLLFAMVLLALPLQAQLRGVQHVLVVGCDGMGSLAFTPTNAPVMHRLMKEGAHTLHARGVLPTVSSPNWASMIMGAGPAQHGITSNEWETNKFEIPALVTGPEGMFPTIFGLLRQQRPNARIVCIHDWDGFGRLFERSAAELISNVKGSAGTAAAAAVAIRERKPTFTFVHFDDVDHAGHHDGWKSPSYFQAVDRIDGLIGDLLKALDDAGIAKATLVLVTADHGGKGTRHGGATIEELEIPWIVRGPSVPASKVITEPVNTYDTAATIAWVFGLKPPSVWVGQPVRSAFLHH